MSVSSSLSQISSTDLIRKEPLDYGGFGEVYLCSHKTLGHVVLKSVYTGPPRSGNQKQSLLDEGDLMSKLSHRRVVKLLGVILEDGNYSLVMELIPRGNLLSMLKKVAVPLSVKGRIILEILEGMVYLTENRVIHKDLKPENILVDKNFHMKIADLGLSRYDNWSKLTQEESRRQSNLGKRISNRGAGTLYYMAPEHLESINTQSSQKSDVYSFAILVWVILTNREPYENAQSETQICFCVCHGQRPDEAYIPPDTPREFTDLMRSCWHKKPEQRPTFAESCNRFLPFYEEKLEVTIKADLEDLKRLYEGPEDLVEKLKLLNINSLTNDDSLLSSRDSPTPLRSSDMGPVEASIEDLSFRPSVDVEIDAGPPRSPNLDDKLKQEYNYHKYGSRIVDQPDPNVTSVAPQQPSSSLYSSTVKSWSKPVTNSEEELSLRARGFGASHRPEYSSPLSVPNSDFERLQSQHKIPYQRNKSAPDGLTPAAVSLADSTTGLRCNSPFVCPPSDSTWPLNISNASAIQIGNYNTMNLRLTESSPLSSFSMGPNSKYKELLQKYESHTVTENQLDLVRENVGAHWKQVARKLGLKEIDLETIEHDYDRDGLAEKVHQMLERWKMKEGLQGFTVGKLCRALEGCVKVNILMKLVEQL
ncbi:hypothetical protein DNTS_001847 [Danionella cerebrum]|uniref:Receptor-interacting serine/threonine-protein kinase 1 n=1 Tax=Danionella cerebrum TaxID=2873325 RepID=A0A553RFU3_9TELE|nr:hypothetical protein DNTS_001847 [Danionella translucida]TRZ01057.1 hypothetical protein DNTS_001847 [Danionella translucida]